MFDAPVHIEVFLTTLGLTRIDPARNVRQFYRMSIQQDLFAGA